MDKNEKSIALNLRGIGYALVTVAETSIETEALDTQRFIDQINMSVDSLKILAKKLKRTRR